MIGDPSGKSQSAKLLSRDRLTGMSQGSGRSSSAFSTSTRPRTPRDHRQRRLARTVRSARVSARHGQVLHRQLHVAEGVDSRRLESEEGISYNRVQLPAAAGSRLRELFDRYACTLQWAPAISGQYHRRHRPGSQLRGKKRTAWSGPHDDGVGHEVRQDGGRHDLLDPARTKPFRFYQFWMNTEDRDVVAYLKYFTFLERGTIADLEAATSRSPRRGKPARAGR